MTTDIARLQAQRDALLSALRALLDVAHFYLPAIPPCDAALAEARACIAEVGQDMEARS